MATPRAIQDAAFKNQTLARPATALVIGIQRAILSAEAVGGYMRKEALGLRSEAEFNMTTIGSCHAKGLLAGAEDMEYKARKLDQQITTLGQLLLDAAPLINTSTTIALRCELLNVALAERRSLTEEDGLLDIVVNRGLEDSLTRGGPAYSGGPLFRGIQLATLYSTPSWGIPGPTLGECQGRLDVLLAELRNQIG